MSEITIKLSLNDPQLLTLMKDGVKSLPPEAWTEIMKSAILEAFKQNLYVGTKHERWEQDRDTDGFLRNHLVRQAAEQITSAVLTEPQWKEIIDAIITPGGIREALHQGTLNYIEQRIVQGFQAAVMQTASTHQLIDASLKAHNRLDAIGAPPTYQTTTNQPLQHISS